MGKGKGKTKNKLGRERKPNNVSKIVAESDEDEMQNFVKEYEDDGETFPLENSSDSEDFEKEMRQMGLRSSHLQETSREYMDKKLLEEFDEDKSSLGDTKTLKDSRRDWGANVRNYYGADDEEDKGESSEEGEENFEIEEAQQVEKEILSLLSPEDFLLEEFQKKNDPETSLEKKELLLEKNIDQLLNYLAKDCIRPSAEEIFIGDKKENTGSVMQLDHFTSPEFYPLLQEIRKVSEEISERIIPILFDEAKQELLTEEGLSFLDVRHHAFLCYLQYLCFYVLLKLKGVAVENHVVIDRLVELKLIIKQLKPLETRFKDQVTKLVNYTKPGLRPALDFGENEGESEPVAGSSEAARDQVAPKYTPPKIMEVHYNLDRKKNLEEKLEKEKQRHEAKLRTSQIVEALREEFDETPVEIRHSFHGTGQSSRVAKIMENIKKKEAFESENLTRLPLTREDKKALKILKNQRSSVTLASDSLKDIESYLDSTMKFTMDDPVLGAMENKRLKKLSEKFNHMERVIASAKMYNEVEPHKYIEARNFEKTRSEARSPRSQLKRSERLPESNMIQSSDSERKIPEVSQKLKVIKDAKVLSKQKRDLERSVALMPKLEEISEQKRIVSYRIMKNKGLTRKRKKIEGHARVHNRLKYQKRIRKLNGWMPKCSDFDETRYAGETTGIRTHLNRSVQLAA